MTTILVQGLAVLMMLFFGAMALLPLLTPDRQGTQKAASTGEDKVLHISPIPMIERLRPVAENQPLPFGNTVPGEDTPGRDAA